MLQRSNLLFLVGILFAFYGLSEAVKCYNCDGDCPSVNPPTCEDNFCWFTGSRIGNGNESAHTGCSATEEIDHIAFIPTNYTLGDCDSFSLLGVETFVKVCNDTNFCNTPCGASGTSLSIIVIFVAVIGGAFAFDSL
uniref:UPAR/Ly6 domain-containing protein n=1 Tax=Panagrellus redivivus TaxID=6233 RepID=A0A7E4UQU9_PANRE